MPKKILITAITLALMITGIAFAGFEFYDSGFGLIKRGRGLQFYTPMVTASPTSYWNTAMTAYWSTAMTAYWNTAMNTEVPE
jgi:hypothetical protein